MRMAKLQKATLDPAKISGYCGRLKCCLRYEDQTYKELSKKLPKKRTRVNTSQGQGFVVDSQVLTQLVKVKADDGSVFTVPLEDVKIIKQPENTDNGQRPSDDQKNSKKNSNGGNDHKNNKEER